jgi:hypothetical protein
VGELLPLAAPAGFGIQEIDCVNIFPAADLLPGFASVRTDPGGEITCKEAVFGCGQQNEFNHLLEICQFHKEKGLSARYQQSLPQNLKEITYILAARRLEIKAFYEYDFEVSVFKAEAFRTYVSRLPNYNFPKETIIQQIPVLEEQFEEKEGK